jgi:hypothetical protein
MDVVPRDQRIRDPLHGLILFKASDETDRIAWELINTREFQRLRRIRQLGFSDMVYPGAAHSRLAHSIGVFHTARRLVGIVAERSGKPDRDRQRVVLLAALLHDIGHGPFSHTFEGAMKRAGKKKDHEKWSSDIICGDSEVHAILDNVNPGLAKAVSDVIGGEEAKDIYATIVSSQFDADRLDYVQRDRLMAGVQFGHVDAEWLFDCLEVSRVTIGSDDDIEQAPCLCLGPKGLRVAEEYLEARHRLYVMVYMHKTTRGVEKMLEHLIDLLSARVADGSIDGAALKGSRLCAFLAEAEPALSSYLALDDAVIRAELGHFRDSGIPGVSELAGRILDRKLYKCFDVGERMGPGGDDQLRKRFKLALHRRDDLKSLPVLSDDASISVYKHYDYESRSALGKVLVKESPQSPEPTDIAQLSSIVASLNERERIYRLYVPQREDLDQLEKIWREVRP